MNNFILWVAAGADIKFRIGTNSGVTTGTVNSIQAISTRLYMTIRKPNGGVAKGHSFVRSVANHLQIDVVEYNVPTRDDITTRKFHSLQSVGSSGDVPVYDLTDLHS